jgi:hypothetical protein
MFSRINERMERKKGSVEHYGIENFKGCQSIFSIKLRTHVTTATTAGEESGLMESFNPIVLWTNGLGHGRIQVGNICSLYSPFLIIPSPFIFTLYWVCKFKNFHINI